MGLWSEQVVPRLVEKVLGSRQHDHLREQTCAGLTGDVVEIGFGSGRNIPHYPPAVRRVSAVEPSDLAWSMSARRRDGSPVPVERAGLDGQALPFADGSFDSALSTWTLCTVPDPLAALRELARVLVPAAACCSSSTAPPPTPTCCAGSTAWTRCSDASRRAATSADPSTRC